MGRSSLTALAITIALVTSLAYAQDAEFYALGDLPGGEFKSSAQAVSNDGQRVVGRGSDGNVDTLTGFLWTPESGIVPLGDTSGGNIAYMVNSHSMTPDGQFVVGRIRDLQNGGDTLFRWTEAGGFLELLSPEEYTRNIAWGVSSDGSVVVGNVTTDDFEKTRAFRWTQQSGLTELGLLNEGDLASYSYGISGDGNVIVGSSDSPGSIWEAFRWTESEGMIGLGFLEGGTRSRANDASGDGAVIVGVSDTGNGNGDDGSGVEAVRWIIDQGIATLGSYPQEVVGSIASAVSDNGNVVVGSWHRPNSESVAGYDSHAFLWTAATGPVKLTQALTEGGADGLDGWWLKTANDISSNGQWVVGFGINPDGNEEAFLARLNSDIVPRFNINAGLNDAWYSPATAGQGFLISVFPDIRQIFLAWFTFDTERPPEDVQAILGDPGHRWLTAQGPYDGETATLTIYVTEGGVFDSANPPASNDGIGDGTLTIEFADCTQGLVTYQINSPKVSGEIPIQRITDDNVTLCESLSGQ